MSHTPRALSNCISSVCHRRQDSDAGELSVVPVAQTKSQKLNKFNEKASRTAAGAPLGPVTSAPPDDPKMASLARSVSFVGLSKIQAPGNPRKTLQRTTSDRHLLNAGGTPPPTNQIRRVDSNRQDFRSVETSLLEKAGLNAWDARLYRAIKLPIVEATIADKRENIQIELLGTGKCGNVYKTVYAEKGGGVYCGAFKPLGDEIKSNGAIASGIDPKNPRIAMRNIVVGDVARALGFAVVDPVKVAIRTLPGGREAIGLETKLVTDGIQADRLADLMSLGGNIYGNPEIWPSLMELAR
jgi:hypothetical protein